jgi:hypothetical protein
VTAAVGGLEDPVGETSRERRSRDRATVRELAEMALLANPASMRRRGSGILAVPSNANDEA